MSELMPCPFCGGEARCTTEATTQDIIGWCSVFCPNCSVSTPRQTSAEAIAAWNLRPAPSPSDAAFGKGIPTSLEVAWDDFAKRKGLAPHGVNAYAVEFARERCADLQAQFRANMEQAPSPSDAAWTEPCNQCGGFGGHEEGCTGHKAPSPSREGWLTRERVENLRDTLIRNDYAPATVNALCDMALSALRPAATMDNDNGLHSLALAVVDHFTHADPHVQVEAGKCALREAQDALDGFVREAKPCSPAPFIPDKGNAEGTAPSNALRPAGDEGLRVALGETAKQFRVEFMAEGYAPYLIAAERIEAALHTEKKEGL